MKPSYRRLLNVAKRTNVYRVRSLRDPSERLKDVRGYFSWTGMGRSQRYVILLNDEMFDSEDPREPRRFRTFLENLLYLASDDCVEDTRIRSCAGRLERRLAPRQKAKLAAFIPQRCLPNKIKNAERLNYFLASKLAS